MGESGNEIGTIPKLLQLLDLQGATVTIDAIGCQTAIAQQIVAAGGDYVLAVKDNQLALAQRLRADVDDLIRESSAGIPHDFHEAADGNHGRIEGRRVRTTARIDWLGLEQEHRTSLRSVAVTESHRIVPGSGKGTEHRRFLSSLDRTDARRLAAAVRSCGHVDNRLRCVLVVGFGRDQGRVRNGRAAENVSRIRREAARQRGIKGKGLIAAWDLDYLLKLLTG